MELQCLMAGLAVSSGYACTDGGGRKPEASADPDFISNASANRPRAPWEGYVETGEHQSLDHSPASVTPF